MIKKSHPLRHFLGQSWHGLRHAWIWRGLRARAARFPAEVSRADWPESLRDPTTFYARAERYYRETLPAEVRAHREFFKTGGRGFGEDAMHAMWFWLWREFTPTSFLEIGVFRGQTVSLAGLLAERAGRPCAVTGISPFTAAGDANSTYAERPDYREDTLANVARFVRTPPELVRAFSTDPAARARIGAGGWAMIYIDGNHDLDVVRQDWAVCAEALAPDGVIVLDDSGLSTPYRPPPGATGGHPGPSQLAVEVDRDRFEEILQVGHNRVFQRRAGR